VIRVQQQQGCTDCGLYAIAFTVDLAIGCTPSTVKYRQAELRSHCKKVHLHDFLMTGELVMLEDLRL